MNNILFIGSYASPLSKERYELIKTNIEHKKIVFFNTGFEYVQDKNVISTKFYFNKYITNILQFFNLLFVIYKYKINILHFHGGFHAFINYVFFFIFKKIKVIVTVQGSEINQHYKGYKKYFVKYLLKKADFVTVKSTFMKNRVQQIVDKKENIVDLNWGVSDSLFEYNQINKNSSTINIISFRATDIIYNIDKIFEAIKKLKERYSTICFSYVEFNKNDKINLDLSIVDKQYKKLSKKELFDILNQQDIMVSIPSYDGFATSLMESLALGVYPIISDIESYNDDELKKYVEVIDLYNERDFIEKLEYCISSIDKIREDMEKRISFAKKNYSRKNQIKNLREIYKS